MWLWKISTHLHIWVHEYLRYKYFSKSHDQVYHDDGKECPGCSPLQRYTCCPTLMIDWNLSRMKIPSILLYKTYISIWHCSVPSPFQILQLCVISICKQKVSIMWRKYVKLKQINIYVFFKFIRSLLNTRQGRITWISLPWTVSMSP